MASYKAAQTKDMDKMLEAADTLTNACSECHDVYREKTEKQGGDAARCTGQ
jgi:cytochrome c556